MPPVRAQFPGNLGRWAMVIAVVALALAATFLRQTGVPKADTMWAEDGAVFAQCAYDQPAPTCLLVPYEGYLHTAPRIGALVVPIGDPGSLPFRLVLVAALFAVAAAVIAALAVADVTSSSGAGLIAGAGLVLVNPAGREVSGNLANLHWILLAASLVVIACSWLGRPPRAWDLALLGLTALTSAFGPLLVPLAAVSLLHRTRWAATMTAVVLVAALPQLAVELTAVRTPSEHPPVPTSVLLREMWRVVFRNGWFGTGHLAWNLAVPVLAAGLALALVLVPTGAAGRAEAGPRWRERLTPVVAILALAAIGLGVYAVSVLFNRTVRPNRYAYLATTMIIVGVALGAGLLAGRISHHLRDRWPRGPGPVAIPGAGALLVAVIVLGLGYGFARTFRVEAPASAGPDAVAEIEALRARCTTGASSIVVDISPVLDNPPQWHVEIPCREFGAPAP